MSSGSKKFMIMIIAVFAVLFFFWASVKFFLKEKNKEIPSKNIPVQNNKQEERQPENSARTELAEKEKLKTFAENFAVIYYSYARGNFSNIETQYDYMSEKMKNEEKNKVEQIKQEAESQPQKYFSARAKLINSAVLLYGENKAEMAVDLNITNFAGAIIQKKTMIWVDEKGNPYMGDIDNLITSSKNKKIKINFIKINDEWKADEIEDIEE